MWQQDWYSAVEQQVAEGVYLISKGQPDEAEALAAQVLSANPSQPDAQFLQSRIHFLRKEERQFRQALEKAWQLAGTNRQLKEDMLRFALEAKFYEKVNSMATELLRADPSNPEYLVARALVRIMEGQESLAVREIESLEAAGIAPAELYYQAGRKITATNPREAEAYLTRAIDTDIMDARYYFSRGLVRLALDKTGPALEDMAMSLDIDPAQPDLYMERAQVRFDLGDSEGACHDWRKALEMGNRTASDKLYKHCRLP
jgi:tetratricopeptide (TPR) repeat protein